MDGNKAVQLSQIYVRPYSTNLIGEWLCQLKERPWVKGGHSSVPDPWLELTTQSFNLTAIQITVPHTELHIFALFSPLDAMLILPRSQ